MDNRLRDTKGRRILNILVAIVALMVSLPIMILIAIAIKVTSPGPIIYRQIRIGLNRRGNVKTDRRSPPLGVCLRKENKGGKPFVIYKFRTMRVDTGNAQVWAKRNDPRITPLGKILRKYRLDELPQLFNVIRGDMNIVGPRPEQPLLFLEMNDKVVGYSKRQDVLPGITGWAQVNQAPDITVADVRHKLILDMEYLNMLSTLKDIHIMVKTLPVMINGSVKIPVSDETSRG